MADPERVPLIEVVPDFEPSVEFESRASLERHIRISRQELTVHVAALAVEFIIVVDVHMRLAWLEKPRVEFGLILPQQSFVSFTIVGERACANVAGSRQIVRSDHCSKRLIVTYRAGESLIVWHRVLLALNRVDDLNPDHVDTVVDLGDIVVMQL